MFILSFKLSPKRMLFGALAVVLVISIGIASGKYFTNKDSVMPAATPAGKETPEKKTEGNPEKESSKKTPKKIDKKAVAAKTNDQRIEFIATFGWEVESEPVEVMEVIIPKEFDDLYKEYNSIQKMQGCDLSSYAGKRCKRYSYTVLNYPGQKENVRINLLVLSNKVIGGDVCSLEQDGFMHGFSME